MKDNLRAHHHRQSDQLGKTPLMADDSGAGHTIDAEEGHRISRRKELRIARREMNFVIAKDLASLPIEDEQRIEPSSARKGRRANQDMAPVRSRGIGNGLQSILNFAAREFPEVHVVSREGAFR